MLESSLNIQQSAQVKKIAKVFALFQKLRDVEGQVQCARQLADLAKDSEASRVLIEREGGLKMVVELAKLSKPAAQLHAARALTSLAENANCRLQIVELGGMRSLSKMLNTREGEIRKAAATCVAIILRDRELHEHRNMVESGVVTALADMDQLASNIDLHGEVAKAIDELTKSDVLRAQFTEAHGVKCLIVISRGSPTLEVKLHATQAFERLSKIPESAKRIVDGKAIDSILSCLEWDWSEDAQRSALATLVHLTGNASSKAKAGATEGGRKVLAPPAYGNTALDVVLKERVNDQPAVKLVIECAKFARKDKVKKLALVLLLRLLEANTLSEYHKDLLEVFTTHAEQSHDPHERAAAAHGYALLLGSSTALRAKFMEDSAEGERYRELIVKLGHSSRIPICEHVAQCLYELSQADEHKPKVADNPKLLKLLLRFGAMKSDPPTVQATAARTLACLADNSAAAKTLVKQNALPVIIGMTTSPHSEVLKHGAMAVSAVAFSGGDSTSIAQNGGLPILVKFGYSKDEGRQKDAAVALASVALNAKVHEMLVNEGAIQLLDKLARSKNDEVRKEARKAKSNFRAMNTLRGLAIFASKMERKDVTPLDQRDMHELVEKVEKVEAPKPKPVGDDPASQPNSARSRRHEKFDGESVDVLRVGLAALANLNMNKQNSDFFVKKCRGIEIVEPWLDPDTPLPGWEEWREEITINAIRAIGNCAHDDDSCKNILHKSSFVTHLVKHLSSSGVRFAHVQVEACVALGMLARRSPLARKHILAASGLDPLVNLLNSLSDKVQVEAARVLAALAIEDKSAIRILDEGALAGIFNMLNSTGGVVAEGANVLAQLCRPLQNHEPIMEKVEWERITRLLSWSGKGDSEAIKESIRVSAARMTHSLLQNKEHAKQYQTRLRASGGLKHLVDMTRSGSEPQELHASRALAIAATDPESRVMLSEEYKLLDSLSQLSKSERSAVKQAAAEALANLVDIEDENDAVWNDQATLSALIALTNAGDGHFPCKAAEALSRVAKKYDGMMKILELGGVASLLTLAQYKRVEAQKPAVRTLCLMSSVAKVQHKIVECGGLDVLLDLAGDSSADDEVEEAALQTIANLAINADNEAKIVAAGGKERLMELAQGHHAPGGDPESIARKAKIAQQALNNMVSSKLFAELANPRGWFPRSLRPGDTKRMVQLLEDNANTGVEREVAKALGNMAQKRKNIPLLIEDGGVDALVKLSRSPDKEVQTEAARAIGYLAVDDKARTLLSENDVVTNLCALLTTSELSSFPNESLLHITHAIANMCEGEQQAGGTLKVLQSGAMHPLVQIVSREEAFGAAVQYEAARVLSAMNQSPDAKTNA